MRCRQDPAGPDQLGRQRHQVYGGWGKVSLTLDRKENNVLITVEDTGIGIPLKDREKVFEMFAQSEKGGKGRRGGGVGIGLAVCRKYMELHSGGIRVESEVQKGSKFTLSFPATLTESTQAVLPIRSAF